MSDGVYWRALESVTVRYATVLAPILRLRPDYLEPHELAIVINYVLGQQLREMLQELGYLRADHVRAALARLPPEQRHPRTAVDALVWYDRGACLNLRLPEVVARGPLFQPSIERAFRPRRRNNTEHSLRAIIGSYHDLAEAIDRLQAELDQADAAPASEARLRAEFKTMQSFIRSGEWHARTAAAWAIKNGFPAPRIGEALVRLFIGPLRRKAEDLADLETRLGFDKHRCSRAACRAAHRVILEIMDASAEPFGRRSDQPMAATTPQPIFATTGRTRRLAYTPVTRPLSGRRRDGFSHDGSGLQTGVGSDNRSSPGRGGGRLAGQARVPRAW
ncbi:MAG: hypothetical protein WED00_00885 [Aquisalimonadaceae bacterium]